MKLINRYPFKNLFYFMILLSIREVYYGQMLESKMLSLRSGDFMGYVDPYMGRFSLMDLGQKNMDLMSILFGSTTAASSYIRIFVDGQSYTLNQLKAIYPFGEGLGSQVDAIFLAGPQDDIRVEVSFFALDIKGNSSFNSLGIALSIANTSLSQIHDVSVKIMLDTDIGESKNNPLIYLPNGQQITQSILIDQNAIPAYFFLGNKQIAAEPSQGDGCYVYPLLSKSVPSAVLIGNWVRISDDRWITHLEDSNLNFDFKSSKDAGIAVYFGNYILNPLESECFGVAISKYLITMCPILDNQIIREGIFSPLRFEVEEIVHNPALRNSQDFADIIDSQVMESFFQKNPLDRLQNRKRQNYRRQMLGWDDLKTGSQCQSQKNKRNNVLSNIDLQIHNDEVWKYLSGINSKMQQLEESISDQLKIKRKALSYDGPPSQGMYIQHQPQQSLK